MHCWNGFLLASCLAFAPVAEVLQENSGPTAQVEKGEKGESGQKAEQPDKRPSTAKELFARFAKMEGLEVSFVEKKHIALLAIPLESSGKIYFVRPGYLTRIVEKPTESRLTITPTQLHLKNSREDKVIDLRQNAELRAFVTSLLHVFAGDQEQLEKSYKVLFELDKKDESKWMLSLTPLKKPLTEMLRSLRLEGSGAAVSLIEMHEPSGDKTVTKVLVNNPKRRFTDKEKKSLFGIEAEKSKPETDSR